MNVTTVELVIILGMLFAVLAVLAVVSIASDRGRAESPGGAKAVQGMASCTKCGRAFSKSSFRDCPLCNAFAEDATCAVCGQSYWSLYIGCPFCPPTRPPAGSTFTSGPQNKAPSAAPCRPAGTLSAPLNIVLWVVSFVVAFFFVPYLDIFADRGAGIRPDAVLDPLLFGFLVAVVLRGTSGLLLGERAGPFRY